MLPDILFSTRQLEKERNNVSSEIEHFVETDLCKLYVILRSLTTTCVRCGDGVMGWWDGGTVEGASVGGMTGSWDSEMTG